MMRYLRCAVPVFGMLLALWACSGSTTSLSSDAGYTIGTACTRTSDCSQGLVCYRTQDLDGGATGKNFLPDGYCTRSCVNDKDCKGDTCMQGYCMKACTSDSDCRGEGYKCWDGKLCVASFDIGKACGTDDECGYGMKCANTDPFPGGYCAFSCETAKDCPVWGGMNCADPSGGDQKFCLGLCATDEDCRSGELYSCRMTRVEIDINGYAQDINACTGMDNIGSTCEKDDNCTKGGKLTLTCAPTDITLFNEKVCTKSCAKDSDCPAGSACAPGARDAAAPACAADTDCNSAGGFICRDLANGFKGCTCAADTDCKGGFTCTDYGNDKVCMCDASDACGTGYDCMDVGQGFTTCAAGFCARDCRSDENCGKANYACRYKTTIDTTNEDLLYCTDENNLGAACASSKTDCTPGLQCVTEDNNPAYLGGFCTITCSTDSDCGTVGARWCSSKGYCERSCEDRDGRGWDFVCARGFYTCHKPDADKGYVCSGEPNYGAACKGAGDCTDGLICREGNAFPGGYCTVQCTSDSDCPAGGTCENGFCARKCDTTYDCGRYGYACLEGSSAKYCSIPPNVGAECKEYDTDLKADCTEGLLCDTDPEWPGGYCTRKCKADDECPSGSGSACIDGMCMRECTRDDECWRTGYTCHTRTRKVNDVNTDTLVCLGVPNVGASCASDDDCTSDTTYALSCVPKAATDKWKGSSCTTACGGDQDCPEYSACGGAGTDKTCIRTCRSDNECGRIHYWCLNAGGQRRCTTNPNIGQACQVNNDCYTGLECRDLAGGLKACSVACTEDKQCSPESNGKCAGDTCVRKCTDDLDCGRPGELFCAGGSCAVVPNYGTPCAADTECWSGLTCIDVGGGNKVCATTCGSNDDCPPAGSAVCADGATQWCMKACLTDDECSASSAFDCDIEKGHCKLK